MMLGIASASHVILYNANELISCQGPGTRIDHFRSTRQPNYRTGFHKRIYRSRKLYLITVSALYLSRDQANEIDGLHFGERLP